MAQAGLIIVRRAALRAGVIGALSLMAVPVALAHQTDANAPAGQAPEVDPAAALAAKIEKELDVLPCTATAEDIEAAIVFSLSQTDAKPEVAHRALLEVRNVASCRGGQRLAINHVSLALAAGDGTTGTAALAVSGTNGGSNGGASFFSAPIVNVGGGSANYSN